MFGFRNRDVLLFALCELAAALFWAYAAWDGMLAEAVNYFLRYAPF